MTTPEQRHRQALATRAPYACALWLLGPCRGRLQAHHPIEAQRLRREYGWRKYRLQVHGERHPILTRPLAELIADGRNAAWVCEGHHPRAGELGPDDLPTVAAFADEIGFEWTPRGWLVVDGARVAA